VRSIAGCCGKTSVFPNTAKIGQEIQRNGDYILEIALNKIRQAELSDFQPRGFRRRHLNVFAAPD
jgi:hypothetical protein